MVRVGVGEGAAVSTAYLELACSEGCDVAARLLQTVQRCHQGLIIYL
jgi:hypothetical protein